MTKELSKEQISARKGMADAEILKAVEMHKYIQSESELNGFLIGEPVWDGKGDPAGTITKITGCEVFVTERKSPLQRCTTDEYEIIYDLARKLNDGEFGESDDDVDAEPDVDDEPAETTIDIVPVETELLPDFFGNGYAHDYHGQRRAGNTTIGTLDFYGDFVDIFNKINSIFFGSELPEPLFVMSPKVKNIAYLQSTGAPSNNLLQPLFASANDKELVHQIAINPEKLITQAYVDHDNDSFRAKRKIVSFITFACASMWQHINASPTRANYVNEELARKLASFGLETVNIKTGASTGQQMTINIADDGMFDNLVDDEFIAQTRLDVGTVSPKKGVSVNGTPQKQKTKFKYSCDGCGVNVWGKYDLNIICGDCQSQMSCED